MRPATSATTSLAATGALPRAAYPAVLVFGAVTVVHLGGHLLAWQRAVDITQTLLMPTLALALLVASARPVPRQTRLALAGMAFAWLGDTAPQVVPEGAAFLAMVGLFLVAQVIYSVAFLPDRARSILHRPLWLTPYLVAGAALVWLCAPRAGDLLPLIVVYACAILCMAVLATGLGRFGAAGGVVFVASDSQLALKAFTDFRLPLHTFWVMLTYVAAQALLAVAVHRRGARAQSRAG